MPIVQQPTSGNNAPLPHEIERQRKIELLKKVKSIREGIMLNRGAVMKGDLSKDYMWVNVRDDRRIFFEQLGFELVKVDPKAPTVVTQWKPKEDGTIVRGDLILYQIDKEMLEAIQIYNESRGLELTENSGEDFETMLGRFGVPSYRPRA